MKVCKICNEEKPLTEFYSQKKYSKVKGEYLYYNPECKDCTIRRSLNWNNGNMDRKLESMKKYNNKPEVKAVAKIYKKNYAESGDYRKWQQSNTDKVKVYNSNRRAFHALLPCTLTIEELNNLQNKFNNRCCLTQNENYELEHFIPLSWGHGGNYLGNIYFLEESLNSSKLAKNPFEWIKEENVRTTIDNNKWNDLINYLANSNRLSLNEFIDFVYWCENNKRTIEELQRDNTPSILLWNKKYRKVIV